MEIDMIYATFCSGIEAPSVAWSGLPWQCTFFSEIEPFPCAVLKHHYPDVPNLGDMTKINGKDYIGAVDLVCAGTPCQSFSVAGKRTGLDDPRGNLALVFLGLVNDMRPRWFVLENVPGLLSSGNGEDFRILLDTIEEMHYVPDVDILDAHFFGVPQRRRRVFVVCQSVEDIQRQKTISSALTIAQCLAEVLALNLGVLRSLSSEGLQHLGCADGEPNRSLLRRIKLFGMDSESQVRLLLDKLAVILPSSEHGQSALDSGNGSAATKTTVDIKWSQLLRWVGEYQNTGIFSADILAETLHLANLSTISTSTNATTERTIYISALASLHIAELIIHCTTSSPCCWSAASSASIALKEFTNYARQASDGLFADMGWIQPWRDFIREAEPRIKTLGDIRDKTIADQVLPLSESLRGNTQARRKARKETARCLRGRANSSHREDSDNFIPETARCLNAKQLRIDGESETFLAFNIQTNDGGAHKRKDRPDGGMYVRQTNKALTVGSADKTICLQGSMIGRKDENGPSGNGISASTAFTLNATDRHAIAFDAAQITSKTNRSRVEEGLPASTLSKESRMHIARVAPTLKGFGQGSGRAELTDGNGDGMIAMPINTQIATRGGKLGKQTGFGIGEDGDPVFTVLANHGHAVAFQESQSGARLANTHPTLDSNNGSRRMHGVTSGMTVRRLTPRECERLQGLPDDYTLIPWRGKSADQCPDSPRYRAIGNSMAVPVLQWIGQRIQVVDQILKQKGQL